jgi:hypothetical protein
VLKDLTFLVVNQGKALSMMQAAMEVYMAVLSQAGTTEQLAQRAIDATALIDHGRTGVVLGAES